MRSKNKIVGLLIAIAFVFPISAFGAVVYERTPAGDSIPNTIVTFSYTADSWEDYNSPQQPTAPLSWRIKIETSFVTYGACQVYDGSHDITETFYNLDIGFYESMPEIEGYPTLDCSGFSNFGYGNNENFTLIAGAISSFKLLGTTDQGVFLSSVGSSVGTSLTSIYLLVAFAVALPLAFWIIHALMGVLRRNK